MLVGGNGARVLERVVAYGDEWMPNRVGDIGELGARIEELQKLAAEAGRDPIPVTLCTTRPEPEEVEHFESAGVHRVMIWLRQGSAKDAEERLDRYAALMAAA